MKYLVCNLKATKTKDEIISYEKQLINLKVNTKVELIICPSTLFLSFFKNRAYKLGAQDISRYNIGPYTGENTAEQLSSLNVKYALIGHSERRNLFDNEEVIIEKIKKAYHSHIKPIYFIGETLEQKNITNIVLENQITRILNQVPDLKREKIIIVYEPIWAIGTGLIPTNEEITKRVESIKTIIKNKYNLSLPILYGGSVNEKNIDKLINIELLDGFVLGESSRNFDELSKIYEKIEKKELARQNST